MAAGTAATEARPRRTAPHARQFAFLLLRVGTSIRRRWNRSSDHSGDGDQREHVWECLEQRRGRRRVDGQTVSERRREAEEERRIEGAERTPVAEDHRSEGDEAASRRHVVVERAAAEADREIRAPEGGED